jgi:hypothetical protein
MTPLERRYSDEELRRILEAATNAEAHSATSASLEREHEGHTLAEIRDIARQVGINPVDIDRAAADLDAPAETKPANAFLGFDLTLHEERVLPRALSDGEMRHLVQLTEQVAHRTGNVRQHDNWTEWQDRKQRLYVGMVRGGDRTHIRVIADHKREFIAGAGAIGLFGLVNVIQTASIGSYVAGAAVVALLIGGLTFGAISLYWKWRTQVSRRNMQELLDILEESLPPAKANS